jgi:hypothetical protein
MSDPIALVSHTGEQLTLYAPSEARRLIATGEWFLKGNAPSPSKPSAIPADPDELKKRAKAAGIKHWWLKSAETLMAELETA